MLFDQLWDEEPIRLLGVRGTRLVREGEPVQMNLFDLDYNSYKKDEKHKKLDAALESIQKRVRQKCRHHCQPHQKGELIL